MRREMRGEMEMEAKGMYEKEEIVLEEKERKWRNGEKK